MLNCYYPFSHSLVLLKFTQDKLDSLCVIISIQSENINLLLVDSMCVCGCVFLYIFIYAKSIQIS